MPPTAPALARTPEEARALRPARGTLALVPTMGALHSGHHALIEAAKQHADTVLVSIFVNPLQFGPGEDYDRYPRAFEADLRACAEAGVSGVFAPSVATMYPERQRVTVDPGPIGEVLEGAARPGHFRGVLTVVAKLLHMVRPDVALFGQKDAQQLAAVRAMVGELAFPVEVVGVPTTRDADGLATSSRNVYLSAAERRSALALSRALRAGAGAVSGGATAVREAARHELAATDLDPPVEVDYLALVDARTFTEVPAEHRGAAVLAVAARVGATRLIDNVPLSL